MALPYRATRSIFKPALGYRDLRHPVYKNLQTAYFYNEDGGLVLNDNQGTFGPATLSGTQNWLPGPHGPVVNYNGGLATGATKVLDPLSWAFWLKYNASLGGFQDPFSKGDGNTSGWLIFSTGGTLELRIAYTVTNFSFGVTTPDTNWHFWVFTWDGSGAGTSANLAIYIDGINVAPTTITASVGTKISDAGQVLTMGAFVGGVSPLVNGQIESLMIWNRTIRAQEVQDLFVATYPSVQPRYAPTSAPPVSKLLTATAATKAGSLLAFKAIQTTLTAGMLRRSAVLIRTTAKTLAATAHVKAGALTAMKANAQKALAATKHVFAGALSMSSSVKIAAVKAQFAGHLSLTVQHEIPPPTCVSVACTELPIIISHVETCENPGS